MEGALDVYDVLLTPGIPPNPPPSLPDQIIVAVPKQSSPYGAAWLTLAYKGFTLSGTSKIHLHVTVSPADITPLYLTIFLGEYCVGYVYVANPQTVIEINLTGISDPALHPPNRVDPNASYIDLIFVGTDANGNPNSGDTFEYIEVEGDIEP